MYILKPGGGLKIPNIISNKPINKLVCHLTCKVIELIYFIKHNLRFKGNQGHLSLKKRLPGRRKLKIEYLFLKAFESSSSSTN